MFKTVKFISSIINPKYGFAFNHSLKIQIYLQWVISVLRAYNICKTLAYWIDQQSCKLVLKTIGATNGLCKKIFMATYVNRLLLIKL